MRRSLQLHPDTPCEAVTGIEVELLRPRSGGVSLRYLVTGRTGDLLLPPPASPERADDLWRRTCFELFVREGEGYCEFNFAPSMQWAAYRFDAYRSGKRAAEGIADPRLALRTGGDGIEMTVLPTLPGAPPWRLGLAAVIEETDGRLSYWALKHPPGKPDFHHSDCFALELA